MTFGVGGFMGALVISKTVSPHPGEDYFVVSGWYILAHVLVFSNILAKVHHQG